VVKGPTIAQKSTIESTTTLLTAGRLSESLLQSRDSYGNSLDNTKDIYQVKFEGAAPFTVTAVYQADGLYKA